VEYSPFDAPPTLPPPGTAPVAGQNELAPTFPQPSLPSVPAAPAAAAVPTTIPSASVPNREQFIASSSPPAPRKKKRGRRALVLIVLAGLLAGGGIIAWQTFGNTEDQTTDDLLVGTDGDEDDASADDTSIGQLAVDVIDETEDVVGQINDNGEETELLAELGLDPTGNPIDEPAAPVAPTRYSFLYSGADFVSSVGVDVDLDTGSYSVETAEGEGARFVDGSLYMRPSADGEWSIADGAPTPRIPQLDEFPTLESVIDEAIRPHVLAEETRENGYGTVSSFLIDDQALHASDPAARAAWLGPWGLDESVVPSAPESTEFTLDAYSGTAPGVTTVQMTIDDTGDTVAVSIGSQVIGGYASIESIATLVIEPRPIEAPPVGG